MTFSEKWRLLTQKSNLLTYGLIALSYVLVIVLFIIVLSANPSSQTNIMASRSDLQSLNSTINNLSSKMKQIEQNAKKATTCEIGWQQFQTSCYFLTSRKSNWMKARSTCVSKHADLAVITSEGEQKFLSGKTGSNPHWIGLTDNEEEGKWTWLDGTDYASSYKSWMPNEPNDDNKNEDCAHMWTNGNWNDKKCSHDEFFAVCEKKIGA